MCGRGCVGVRRRARGFLAGLSCLIGSGAALGASNVTVRTVAYVGQTAPGLGQPFYSFNSPVLNDGGRVAFVGEANFGSPVAVWSEGLGALSLVASRGHNAPGTDPGNGNGPAQFSSFSDLVLNDAGQAAFFATLTGTGVGVSNNRAIFSQGGSAGGALRKVARTGDAAPTYAGLSDVYSDVSSPRLNDAGRIAFGGGVLDNGSGRSAAWVEDSAGQVRVLARQDAVVPGLTPTTLFGAVNPPVLNDMGQALLKTEAAPGHMLWSSGGKIFRSFEAVPGRSVEWTSFDAEPVLNNAGRLAFVGTTRTGVGAPFVTGMWTGTTAGMRELYRPGTPAPGMGAGAVFSGGSLPSPVINEKGEVAFRANVTTPGGVMNTIYATRDGGQTLELLVRQGQAAAGTAAGTVISGFPVGMDAPAFNARGTIAFIAGLSGPGVTMANDQALYAVVGGVMRLIAREGDPIQVRPGVVRTVRGIGFLSDSGNQEGRPSALNEYDQVAFTAGLNDAAMGAAVILADAGLAGDVDANRIVDHADFLALYQNFGRAGHRGQGDFNGDGAISFADFQIMERNFGKTLAMVAAGEGVGVSVVPEPHVAGLAALILAMGQRRRGRKATE
jgi:hypothetical protein